MLAVVPVVPVVSKSVVAVDPVLPVVPVVPVDPVAVKAIAVPLKDVLVTVASLLTEQELVPQVVLVVVVRMNVTVAEWDRELLVPVTVTV